MRKLVTLLVVAGAVAVLTACATTAPSIVGAKAAPSKEESTEAGASYAPSGSQSGQDAPPQGGAPREDAPPAGGGTLLQKVRSK
jgi:hypothetical protein